jgi:hypothetical protein
MAEIKPFKVELKFSNMPEMAAIAALCQAARDLCRTIEVVGTREACKGSNSLDIPVELLELCDAVDAVYGPFDPEADNGKN